MNSKIEIALCSSNKLYFDDDMHLVGLYDPCAKEMTNKEVLKSKQSQDGTLMLV